MQSNRFIIVLSVFLACATWTHTAQARGEMAHRFGSYVKLPLMGFSLIHPSEDRVVGFLVFSPAFEAASDDIAKEYTKQLPIIQNAIIHNMHIYLSLFWRLDKPVNIKHLQKVVHQSLKKIMKDDLKKIYVQEIRMNRSAGRAQL